MCYIYKSVGTTAFGQTSAVFWWVRKKAIMGHTKDADKEKTRVYLTDADTIEYNEIIERSKLSERQRIICDLRFLEGRKIFQIAMDLGISAKTVGTELGHILDKTGRVIRKYYTQLP